MARPFHLLTRLDARSRPGRCGYRPRARLARRRTEAAPRGWPETLEGRRIVALLRSARDVAPAPGAQERVLAAVLRAGRATRR